MPIPPFSGPPSGVLLGKGNTWTGYPQLFSANAPAYASGTTYHANDVVSSVGILYKALQTTTGNAPPNPTYWGLAVVTSIQWPGWVVGAYSGSLQYEPGMLLTYLGIQYRCILESTGNLPTNVSYFAPDITIYGPMSFGASMENVLGATYDPLGCWGYNVSSDANLIQPTECSAAYQVEGHWNDSSGHLKSEIYCQYNQNVSGAPRRSFYTQYDQVNGDLTFINLSCGPGVGTGNLNGINFYCIPNGSSQGTGALMGRFQGLDIAAYNNGTTYTPAAHPNDLVTLNGQIYQCIATTTGNAPPNASFWATYFGIDYQPWATATTYGPGNIVYNAVAGGGDNKYYVAIAQNNSQRPDISAGQWTQLGVAATAYDPTGAYAVGTLVSLGGLNYQCVAPTLAAPNWSGATTFVIGNYTTSGGTQYRCLLGNTNNVPPNATYWAVDTTQNPTNAVPFSSYWSKSGVRQYANLECYSSINKLSDLAFTDTTTLLGRIFTTGGHTWLHGAGTSSVFCGKDAGNLTLTGNTCAGFGHQALTALTTGISNSALGYQSSVAVTTGQYCTSAGFQALLTNSTGNYNTAIGTQALQLFTGSQGTAVGYQALENNVSGTGATAVGFQAGKGHTGGGGTFVGNSAGLVCTGASGVYVGNGCGIAATGAFNTCVGATAGQNITSGAGNTVVGYFAGNTNITTVSNSVFVGRQSSSSTDGLTDMIVIGFSAQGTASHQVMLGANTITATVLQGQVQIAGNIALSTAQTSVGGSVSGTAVFSQPNQGSSYKMVVIKMAALVGTASYTFPTAFTTAPSVVATDDVAAGIVTAKSTTAVTVTGATSSGCLMLIGY